MRDPVKFAQTDQSAVGYDMGAFEKWSVVRFYTLKKYMVPVNWTATQIRLTWRGRPRRSKGLPQILPGLDFPDVRS
jgi:hypothetical protein